MSEKELETVDLEEKKASFNVDAEVPEPTAKSAKGEVTKGEKPVDKNGAPKQGNSEAPKKYDAVKAISDVIAGLKKEDFDAKYDALMAILEDQEVEGDTIDYKEVRKVTAEDVDVSEDVAAMFDGQELSEDFTAKATGIFEAAVVSKVNEVLESVTIDMEAEVEASKESVMEDMSAKLDDYLSYVAEEWMEENTLAVDSGIRAEIAENFMAGLRDLFVENYIEIPEDKVDVVAEMAEKVEELESQINEEIEKNIGLKKELNGSLAESVLRSVSKDLTESQIIKLESLTEGVEFEDAESYKDRLETLKESYFKSEKTEMLSEETNLDDEPLELEEETVHQVSPEMGAYMNAISKSIKK